MVCYEISSLTCQMNSVNKCILSHKMRSPHICILSLKIMYSIPQNVFHPSRRILLKDLLQQLNSIHFLPSCRLPLHFVLLDSAKSFTDRSVLLSCLVFTSVAAIGHLTTSGTGFKGVSPKATVSTPVHRLSQLRRKLTSFLVIPSDSDISSANSAVLPHICSLAGRCAVPHLVALPAGCHHRVLHPAPFTKP